jgi:Lipopolysaccharide kinase (Kdo/WaaP) family
MKALGAVRVEREGWEFFISDDPSLPASAREELVALALSAARGSGRVVRRSRNAASYRARLGGERGADVFLKVLDAPAGAAALKLRMRGLRVAHVARITAFLMRDGLLAPAVLVYGVEPKSGREIIAIARAAGVLVSRWLRVAAERGVIPIESKRVMLRALGSEIARLHRAGYLHGDLTPYNVLVADGDRPRVIFIDHERTRRSLLARLQRPRLRNLVQLGHFELAGLSRSDRMRVWQAYAADMEPARRRAMLRRLVRMLAARVARERGRAPATRAAHPAAAGEATEG